ncbi:MAG: integrase core domain-containing protein [Halobacteria archaeon]
MELHQIHGVSAVAIDHILRVRDDVAIANNKVHEILLDNNSVTRNKRKQGRQRPWVRWERDYSLISVHLDWYYNERDEWCLAVEDDGSRMVLDMIEVDSASAEKAVELLDEVRREFEEEVPVLEVITDNGTEFVNSKTDGIDPDHVFEGYLEENGIDHTLCKVGRPQINGKIERFYQTYGKQRWRFSSLDEFIGYYNTERPHMSLKWGELETPSEAFERLLPTPEELENHLQNSQEVES